MFGVNSSAPGFTLRQLHYFVAVVRHGQVSAAAAQVGLSQSAMTLAITELEQIVGVQLLERGRQGATPTAEGRAFLDHAQRVLQAADDAARLPTQRPESLVGKVRVAASYTVLGYLLLPALSRFAQRHPEVEVDLIELPRDKAEAALLNGDIDLSVLLLSNVEGRERFQTKVLARSRRQLWVAPDHPLAEQGSVSFDQIAQYPFIELTVDEGGRNAAMYWSKAGLQPTRRLSTTSMEAVREMVALGLGVTILSDMVYRPLSLEGRRIVRIPVDARLPTMEVGLAWQKGVRLSACGDALRGFLSRALNVDTA